MEDVNQEVPESAARFIGHVCGVIFIAHFLFSLWMVYDLASNPRISTGIAASLLITTLSTCFFGTTAIKLTSGKKSTIISRNGYLLIAAFPFVFSALCATAVIQNLGNPDFTVIDRIVWTIFSLAMALSGYFLYRLLKTKLKKF